MQKNILFKCIISDKVRTFHTNSTARFTQTVQTKQAESIQDGCVSPTADTLKLELHFLSFQPEATASRSILSIAPRSGLGFPSAPSACASHASSAACHQLISRFCFSWITQRKHLGPDPKTAKLLRRLADDNSIPTKCTTDSLLSSECVQTNNPLILKERVTHFTLI
ncbi:hypothetical protein IRJ41_014270 [Triplophysa rosa]|uniref:Uncharacterized protein n=1 Tax=Triplophysa rosa TaxID=992332 RepID=A0A9W7WTN0_TRIRA|nr:hypothetical protein IRJ41_014270 [Triplophysa rosa]